MLFGILKCYINIAKQRFEFLESLLSFESFIGILAIVAISFQSIVHLYNSDHNSVCMFLTVF